MKSNTPSSHHFKGKEALIKTINQHFMANDIPQTTQHIANCLRQAITQSSIELPTTLTTPPAHDYTRHLLHEDNTHHYVLMIMVWGPKHITPLHDHQGLWCIEAVWRGCLSTTLYEKIDDQAQPEQSSSANPTTTHQFKITRRYEEHPGDISILLPPHEYHTIKNPNEQDCAISLHVYEKALLRPGYYMPQDSGGYEKQVIDHSN